MKRPLGNDRILVTGGSGFIGTNLITDLRQRDATVLNVDHSPPLNAGHTDIWRNIDVLDRPGLVSTIREEGIACRLCCEYPGRR